MISKSIQRTCEEAAFVICFGAKAAYGIIMVDLHDPDDKYVETSEAEIPEELLTSLSRDRQQEAGCRIFRNSSRATPPRSYERTG